MTTLGVIFPPDQPPERLREVALAADRGGVDELWLWEDCFKESALATTGAVLAWTDRLSVGIGLLPVPLRNVAITAMELATLERLFPGRVVPGIGHGVLDWMGQVGARAESPMTLLREYTDALQRLLRGETVTTDGRYVHLDDVALDWPPASAPRVLVGAQKPRTAALAGELGDGLIITSDTDLPTATALAATTRSAARDAGRPEPAIVAFATADGTGDAADIAEVIRAAVRAGATSVALQDVSDEPDLPTFAARIGGEVRPLLD